MLLTRKFYSLFAPYHLMKYQCHRLHRALIRMQWFRLRYLHRMLVSRLPVSKACQTLECISNIYISLLLSLVGRHACKEILRRGACAKCEAFNAWLRESADINLAYKTVAVISAFMQFPYHRSPILRSRCHDIVICVCSQRQLMHRVFVKAWKKVSLCEYLRYRLMFWIILTYIAWTTD